MVRALRRYLGAVLTFSWVARSDGHCRGLDRRALINLYEALDGANWTNNKNWNVTSGTPAENKANDPCSIEKRWFGVGFSDPCEKYLDDIVGWGPETDYLAQVRGAGQGCFAGRITALNLHREFEAAFNHRPPPDSHRPATAQPPSSHRPPPPIPLAALSPPLVARRQRAAR